MDSKTKYTYANLFSLEPLMDFQLPKQDEDSDCFESSSQDESKGNQGKAIGGHTNGMMSDRRLRKKKRLSVYGSEDEEASNYSPSVSEERYRTMLGDHIQKYKRRVNNSSQSPASAKTGTPVMKSGLRLKDQKITVDSGVGLHKREQASNFLNIGSQKLGNYLESDIGPQYGAARPIKSRHMQAKFYRLRALTAQAQRRNYQGKKQRAEKLQVTL
ncbi:chromatin-remodeling ATPase INO80-like [Primulina huaijiensis]|uniref:chromatin-remodeling ATPase INO80-like n=1 Tax=Primulina huaijiensis TaxID=1492673 RepID=UPI003CC7998A